MNDQFNHTRSGGKMYVISLWIIFIAFIIWYLVYFFSTIPINISKDESLVESFVFQKAKNENLKDDIEGTVNDQARIVYFQNPDGADLIYLKPTIIFDEKVTSYAPKGYQDFSKPFVYTLTLKNGEEVQFYILNEKSPDSFNTSNNFWKRFVRGLKHLF